MKIDYAVVSSDDNPMYLEFWESVKNLWFNLIGIKPILIKISNHDAVYEHNDCIIHNIKKVEGINTGFQAQIARMYITKFYPDKVCITSDIDMLPLSKKYFVDDIQNLNSDKLVIFSSDAYPGIDRYPICYNAGTGTIFNNVMQFEDTFSEYCKKLHSFNLGWDTDELYFGKKVNDFKNQDCIVKLNRNWTHGIAKNRIDRVHWFYNTESLKNQEYIDSHSLRPYSKYNHEINFVINQALSSKK